MICRGSLMLIVLANVSTLAYAADEPVTEEPAPDFIEFLGEWETADGEWVDPNELEQTEADTQADADLELAPAEEQTDE
ncbi:MAG: hypothetical protein HW386_808 [Gammaproteobacteria bacterium]|nr:hypothetical protein [Gammaproteobacteria bacterium]